MGRRRKRRPSHSHSDSDSDFHDNEDDDFSVISHKNPRPKKNAAPKQNRKKLALSKHPQGQKSALTDAKERGRRVSEDAVDVFDSEEDSSPSTESRRFQTLLDAVFDKSGEPLDPLPGHLIQQEGQAESMHVERAVQDSPATLNVQQKQQSCSPSRSMPPNKDGIDGVYTEDAVNKREKSEDCQMLLAILPEKDKGEKPVAILSCLTDGVHEGGSYKETEVGTERGTRSSKEDTQDDSPSDKEQNDQDEDYCIGQDEAKDDFCSEEKGNTEDEDYCADDSDGLVSRRRKLKNKKNATVALEPRKTDFMVSHAKKVRSRVMYERKRTVSENMDSPSMSPVMATDKWKNSSELSSIEPPKSGPASHVGECDKENSECLTLKSKPSGKSANVETMQSSNTMKRFRATTLAGLKNGPSVLPGTRASLKINMQSSGENISSDCPNAKILQLQSSLLPHQRVIGLSRRVRLAPLHPYLSKADK